MIDIDRVEAALARAATTAVHGTREERQGRFTMTAYLIWSNEHQGWWKANRHGYTTRTDKAGHFSFGEASAICEQANRIAIFKREQSGQRGGNLEEVMVEAPSPEQIKLDLEH